MEHRFPLFGPNLDGQCKRARCVMGMNLSFKIPRFRRSVSRKANPITQTLTSLLNRPAILPNRPVAITRMSCVKPGPSTRGFQPMSTAGGKSPCIIRLDRPEDTASPSCHAAPFAKVKTSIFESLCLWHA